MTEEHYIEWIALSSNEGVQIKWLKPGEAPIAEFKLTDPESIVEVYAYCNLHGLWKKEVFTV